jgi:hypothetical protein
MDASSFVRMTRVGVSVVLARARSVSAKFGVLSADAAFAVMAHPE